MNEFALLARDRWIAGRAERGLAPDAPFQGDPIHEFREEILDAANYLGVMKEHGLIGQDVMRRSVDMLHDLWMMANTVEHARDSIRRAIES